MVRYRIWQSSVDMQCFFGNREEYTTDIIAFSGLGEGHNTKYGKEV